LKHDDAKFQLVIPANTWFAAELLDKNSYVLVGCTVSPGFEYSDFEIANKALAFQYPQHKEIIQRLLPKSAEEKKESEAIISQDSTTGLSNAPNYKRS
jgi:hypothetical protein